MGCDALKGLVLRPGSSQMRCCYNPWRKTIWQFRSVVCLEAGCLLVPAVQSNSYLESSVQVIHGKCMKIEDGFRPLWHCRSVPYHVQRGWYDLMKGLEAQVTRVTQVLTANWYWSIGGLKPNKKCYRSQLGWSGDWGFLGQFERNLSSVVELHTHHVDAILCAMSFNMSQHGQQTDLGRWISFQMDQIDLNSPPSTRTDLSRPQEILVLSCFVYFLNANGGSSKQAVHGCTWYISNVHNGWSYEHPASQLVTGTAQTLLIAAPN